MEKNISLYTEFSGGPGMSSGYSIDAQTHKGITTLSTRGNYFSFEKQIDAIVLSEKTKDTFHFLVKSLVEQTNGLYLTEVLKYENDEDEDENVGQEEDYTDEMLADEPTPIFMLSGPPVEGYIEVECEHDWQEYFLILCWSINEGLESYGKELYGLEDDILKNIFTPFVGEGDYEKFNHFFEELIYLIQHKSKLKKFSNKKLSEIINENGLSKHKKVWNKLKQLITGELHPIEQKKIEKPKVHKRLTFKQYKYRDREVVRFIKKLQIALLEHDINFFYKIIDEHKFVYFYLYEEKSEFGTFPLQKKDEILSFWYRRMWNNYENLKIGDKLFEEKALELGMKELGGIEYNSYGAKNGSPFRNWYLNYSYWERVTDDEFREISKNNKEFFKSLHKILFYYFKLFHPKINIKKILSKL